MMRQKQKNATQAPCSTRSPSEDVPVPVKYSTMRFIASVTTMVHPAWSETSERAARTQRPQFDRVDIDNDGDGLIGKSDREGNPVPAFDRLDDNDDGRIDPAEFRP